MSSSGPILDQHFFAERRARAFERMGDDSVLILEGAPPETRYDVPFRQPSNLYYLTGFPEPNAVAALISTPTEKKYFLFVQPRDAGREQWDGPRAGVDGAVANYGADAAFPIAELKQQLHSHFDKTTRLFLSPNPETGIGRELFELFRATMKSSVRIGRGLRELRDPLWILAEMRMCKTPEEMVMMRHAATITRETYLEVLPRIRTGVWEYEIEARLDYGFRSRGGDGPAYISIIGSGANATVLHYVDNRRQMRAGELLLIDAGGSYQHYACDVTRTYPVGGKFTAPQRRVYEAVLRAQKAVIAAAKPGMAAIDLHKIAAYSLIEDMVDMGWLEKKPTETLYEENAHRPYFMHGVGHPLGLDTHDAAVTESEGKPYPYQEGTVVTVEPGLYVSPALENAPEGYQGIGVRIEDNIFLTGDGCEVLTAGIPKEFDEIEAILSSA